MSRKVLCNQAVFKKKNCFRSLCHENFVVNSISALITPKDFISHHINKVLCK